MNRRNIIAVDVDDIVADLCPTWMAQLRRLFPAMPDVLADRTWTSWDVAKRVPEAYHTAMWDILDGALYELVKPIPDSLRVVNLMRKRARVVFVTSCNHKGNGAKLSWLVRHGYLSTTHFCPDYVEATDKTLIHADYIIDDRPKTCREFEAVHGRGTSVLVRRTFTDNHVPGTEDLCRVSSLHDVQFALWGEEL